MGRFVHELDPRPGRRPVLVCVPPAGAGRAIYRGWARDLGRTVEVVAVDAADVDDEQHPVIGDALAASVAADLAPYHDRPLAVFGHSAGCALAFHVALRLAAARPSVDVVLAAPPPDPFAMSTWVDRPDRVLFADLASLGLVRAADGDDVRIVSRVVAAVRRDVQLALASLRAVEQADGPSGVRVEHWWAADDPAGAPGDRSHLYGFRIERHVLFEGGHFFPFGAGSTGRRRRGRRVAAARPVAAG